LIKKFSGIKGSRIFDELEKESTVYWAWTLKKKEAKKEPKKGK